MRIEVACPSCRRGQAFADFVPFRADCEACGADLHVCLGCSFHDRYVENECREHEADPIAQKDRRNLCEYFRPLPANTASADPSALAKAKLAALFGAPPLAATPGDDPVADAKRKLEALFQKPTK